MPLEQQQVLTTIWSASNFRYIFKSLATMAPNNSSPLSNHFGLNYHWNPGSKTAFSFGGGKVFKVWCSPLVARLGTKHLLEDTLPHVEFHPASCRIAEKTVTLKAQIFFDPEWNTLRVDKFGLKTLGQVWCRRSELNRHVPRGHGILSPARLPVPPRRHIS